MYLNDRIYLLSSEINNFVGIPADQQTYKFGKIRKDLSLKKNDLSLKNTAKKIYMMNMMSPNYLPIINLNDSFYYIKEVIELYQSLSFEINEYFGKQILVTLLSSFICITVQLYYVIQHIGSGFSAPGAEILVLGSCCLLILHILEYWVILTSGDMAKKQVVKTEFYFSITCYIVSFFFSGRMLFTLLKIGKLRRILICYVKNSRTWLKL